VHDIVIERHIDPEERARHEFLLLPFQVPEGAGALQVSIEVSQAIAPDKAGWQEGNIIDVGLFDPRGSAFPDGEGFRGWSGATRYAFTVGSAEAAPGYLAGPIYPGTWQLLLGLHQLAAGGCDVRAMIRPRPAPEEQSSPVALPCPFETRAVASGGGWLRGDLHCHSDHSDGTAPLPDLLAAARAQGLDFLAVTEHNTVSHLPPLRELFPQAATGEPPLLLLPGMEITTYHGHANIWPVSDWFDFRIWEDDQLRVVREMVRQQGALFSVNHPKEGGPPWQFSSFFEPDCMEVWGAPWFVSNYQALATWDRLLQQGQRVTAVGGSDKHQAPFTGELGWYEIGTPTTWVWAEELSIPAIVEGLRAGRVFVSEGPGGPGIELVAEAAGQRATMGQVLPVLPGEAVHLGCRVLGAVGCLLRLNSAQRTWVVEIDSEEFEHTWRIEVKDDLYLRPEVIDRPEVPLKEEPAALVARALGNPVYLSQPHLDQEAMS